MSFNDLERGQSSQPLVRGSAGQGMLRYRVASQRELGADKSFFPSPHYLCLVLVLPSTDTDKAFTTAKDAVSIQVFKIQSNVQGIQRLVDKLGGAGDGPALRTSLCVYRFSLSLYLSLRGCIPVRMVATMTDADALDTT